MQGPAPEALPQPKRGLPAMALGGAMAALLAALLCLQVWALWKSPGEATLPAAAATGRLCSVMLTNGQIYYGTLTEASARYVLLTDVYYVQLQATEGPGGQPANRLVSRRKSDWHGPETMTIPIDKVLMLETVGADSAVAQLIQRDRTASAPPAH